MTPTAILGTVSLSLLFAQTPQTPNSTRFFEWGEVYVDPNPVPSHVTPTFYAELTQLADTVELRIYSLNLIPIHTRDFKKPTKASGGKYIYRYSWKGALGQQTGVYFYLFRAAKTGHPTLKIMKSIKITR
ncbi:MAG: hypothetical protein HY399_01100 [Elusimicrobia bacterium]|nr:hypothetical protein [Elusimicrobiota bacterium]